MYELHLFISGMVQGVNFRSFVRHHAKKLGLVGWVKNGIDGRVEVVTQGEKGDLEALLFLCRQGPKGAQVVDVLVEWRNIEKKCSNFEIRFF